MNENQERNYGIDLLKIISMYMVVQLHVLGCGGILGNCEKFSFNYYVAWFLEISAYCAVNVFAMITGYLMVEKKINRFKIIPFMAYCIFVFLINRSFFLLYSFSIINP